MGNSDQLAEEGLSARRWIIPLLVFITVAALGGVLWCGFVNFDDPLFVLDNSFVRQGLTFDTIRWAMTHTVGNLYHPVNFLSLALDVQLFGTGAAGFHFTNLLIHCVNAVLLYRLLRKISGETWRSAWVAAIWAVHPMRVESVAWIAERKDMLMGLFGLAALYAYSNYVQNRRPVAYALSVVLLALSLLAKPTLVMMPALLLLLDIWPFGRSRLWRNVSTPLRSWRFLLLEKLPVLFVCGIFVVLGLLSNVGVSMRPVNRAGSPSLMGFAQLGFMSYAWYAAKLVDFRHLAVFYPIPISWPAWWAIASFLFVALSSGVAIVQCRTRPWLFVGWFWFVVILLPVVCLFHAQTFWHADRYTYLPSIGLLLIVAWWVPNAWATKRSGRGAIIAVTTAVLLGLIVVSERNVRYWRDSETLWSHALQVTNDNWMAETNYAVALFDSGAVASALPHVQEAMRLNPDYSLTRYNYGNYFLVQGDRDHALAEYRTALNIAPSYAAAASAIARLLMQDGRYAEAVSILTPVEPENPAIRPVVSCCRGYVAMQQNRPAAAVNEFTEGVNATPNDVALQTGLGDALLADDRPAAAATAFQAALRLDPLSADLQQKLRDALSHATTRPTR